MADTAKVGRNMGRKPVDQVQQAQHCLNPQDAIWKAIRALKRFSRADIAHYLAKQSVSGVNDYTIDSYVDRLSRGRFITCVETEPYRGVATRSIFELINDTGREAPRLRADGSPSLLGLGTEQMWRAMKVLGDFTYRELVLAASTDTTLVSEATAKSYIKTLRAAGYLADISGRHAGDPRPARYKLLPSMNTGPRPPVIQKTKRVFDQNLKKIVWREDAQ